MAPVFEALAKEHEDVKARVGLRLSACGGGGARTLVCKPLEARALTLTRSLLLLAACRRSSSRWTSTPTRWETPCATHASRPWCAAAHCCAVLTCLADAVTLLAKCLQPTFTFFKDGKPLGEIRGADAAGVRAAVATLKDA